MANGGEWERVRWRNNRNLGLEKNAILMWELNEQERQECGVGCA